MATYIVLDCIFNKTDITLGKTGTVKGVIHHSQVYNTYIHCIYKKINQVI